MEAVNTGKEFPSAQLSLTDFIEKHYLPCCKAAEKSAATVKGYKTIWERRSSGQIHSRRDHFPYFSLIARRNWRIISRELCSMVPSW